LEDILAKHAAAMGGVDKLESVRSSATWARIDMGGMVGTSVSYFKAPDKYRSDLTLPLMGFTMACDDGECWMRDRDGLVHTLQAELKSTILSQSVLERWSYLDPARFDGKMSLVADNAKVDSVACYEISIEPAGGAPTSLFIDKNDYLPVEVSMVTDMATVITRYSDFRSVNGVKYPFEVSEQTDAGIVTTSITIDSIIQNQNIPDSLFERPETGAAASRGGFDSLIVPVEFEQNHIFVKVRINGKGPFDFVFDSGAGGLVISTRLIPKLNLQQIGRQEARGVGGADSAEVYAVDSLQLRTLGLDSLMAFSVDFGSLDEAAERHIDGAIGYDLLSRYIVRINYADKLLTLYDKGTSPRPDWGSRCDLTIDFRLPYIEAKVNDSIKGMFRLDTGSRSSVDFNSPFVKEHGLIDTVANEYATTKLVGLGGTIQSLMGFLPSLELCGAKIDSLFAGYSTSVGGMFSGRNTAGNIGSGVLKGFAVTFDYNDEAVYFKEGKWLSRMSRIRNMAGALFARFGDSIRVAEVFPGGKTAENLKPGDRLVKVGGRYVTGLDVADVNWLLIGKSGSRVDLEILRNGALLKKRIELQRSY
jgi:outer membrane lipoprotein-sorting protein